MVNKSYKNYHYNREDTMTKIVGTHIRNLNETVIGICMSIPVRYIVYYHPDRTIIRKEKRTRYSMITKDTLCMP